MKNESCIQSEIVEWFNNNYCLKFHVPKCAIFSVPNENQYHKVSTGVKAGVSDLIVLLPNKALFIEVKDDKGKQSDKQKEFEQTVKDLNFEYHLVRSLEEFKQIVMKYKNNTLPL